MVVVDGFLEGGSHSEIWDEKRRKGMECSNRKKRNRELWSLKQILIYTIPSERE